MVEILGHTQLVFLFFNFSLEIFICFRLVTSPVFIGLLSLETYGLLPSFKFIINGVPINSKVLIKDVSKNFK